MLQYTIHIKGFKTFYHVSLYCEECDMQKNEIWYHFLLFKMPPESDLEHGGPEEDVTDAWGNGPKTGGV